MLLHVLVVLDVGTCVSNMNFKRNNENDIVLGLDMGNSDL
jgi:hypothetical protein